MIEKSEEQEYEALRAYAEHELNLLRESRKHNSATGKTRDGMRGFGEHVSQAYSQSKGNASGLLAGLIRRI